MRHCLQHRVRVFLNTRRRADVRSASTRAWAEEVVADRNERWIQICVQGNLSGLVNIPKDQRHRIRNILFPFDSRMLYLEKTTHNLLVT